MNKLKQKLRILLALFSALFCFLVFEAIKKYQFEKKAVVIGSKSNTEQHLLAEMIAQLIEKETDIPVVRRFNLDGTTICFHALKSGNIDLYIEYTGGALTDILKQIEGPAPLFPYLKEIFLEAFDIEWMPLLGFTNQYALVTRTDFNVTTTSQLRALKGHLRFASDPEFSARLEADSLCKSFNFPRPFSLMDQVLLHFTLLDGQIDAFVGDSTDGRLAHRRIAILEDDLDIFPKYEAAPLVRSATLNKYPQLRKIFERLGGSLTTEKMRAYNALIDKEKRHVEKVATQLLLHLD